MQVSGAVQVPFPLLHTEENNWMDHQSKSTECSPFESPLELSAEKLLYQAPDKKILRDDEYMIVDRQDAIPKQKLTLEQMKKQMKKQISKDQSSPGCLMYADCSFCMHWNYNEDSGTTEPHDFVKCSELQESCDCFSEVDFSKYFSCCTTISDVFS